MEDEQDAHRPVLKLLLLTLFSQIHVRNQRGETALHLAVQNRLSRVVEEMLSAGCDPLNKDNSGKRPIDLIAKDDSAMRTLIETAVAQREKMPSARSTVAPRRSNLPYLSALSAHRSKKSCGNTYTNEVLRLIDRLSAIQ